MKSTKLPLSTLGNNWKEDEQGSVIGQTGSGKSVWTKKLIVPYIGKRQIIILDPKHDDEIFEQVYQERRR